MLADNGHGEWRVAVPAGWTNLAFFKLAERPRRRHPRLLRDDETLEELFLNGA